MSDSHLNTLPTTRWEGLGGERVGESGKEEKGVKGGSGVSEEVKGEEGERDEK